MELLWESETTHLPPVQHDLTEGTMKVGDYQVLWLLGKGEFGTVHACQRKGDSTELAIKMIDKAGALRGRTQARAIRAVRRTGSEIQAMQRKDAIERAQRMLYEDSDKVKTFSSGMLLSDVLEERQAQIELSQKKRQIEAAEDEAKSVDDLYDSGKHELLDLQIEQSMTQSPGKHRNIIINSTTNA